MAAFFGCAPQPEAPAETRAAQTAAREPESKGAAWTVLVYMCGSDLESQYALASGNLMAMMEVPRGGDVNFVVQTGGSKAWGDPADPEEQAILEEAGVLPLYTASIDAGKLQRYEVTDELVLVDEQPLASMGDPQTLEDFLAWGVENYPAERMGVVIWNHGGGSLSGAAFDELYENDSLSLAEMDSALGGVSAEMTDKFEFIGFDACLMATVETAKTLAPYARYLYASEEVEPGSGWDYSAWAQVVEEQPGIGGAELGKVICDSYYAQNYSEGGQAALTLSVTDLSKIDGVVAALDGVAGQLQDGLADPAFFGNIARGSYRAENYGAYGIPDGGYSNLIDLGDFAARVEGLDPALVEALSAALDEAVVYTVEGENRAYGTGLSVYYPLAPHMKDINKYRDIAASPAYYDFLNGLVQRKVEYDAMGVELIELSEEPHITEDNHYEMTIAPQSLDYVQDIVFMLFAVEDGGGTAVCLGDDNNMFMDWDTGVVRDNFDGAWAMLNGQPVMLDIQDNTEDYILYNIPVMVNGEQTNLRASWNWDGPDGEGHFEVLGLWQGVDAESGVPTRMLRPLLEGDVVAPMYYVITSGDEEQDEEAGQGNQEDLFLEEVQPGEEFVIEGRPELAFGTLPEGLYRYMFVVMDVYGAYKFTAPVDFLVNARGEVTDVWQ